MARRRHLETTAWIGSIVALVLLPASGSLLAGDPAYGDEEWRRQVEEEHPDVPEGLFQQLVDHVKSLSIYRAAQAVELERARMEIDKWSETTGIQIKVRARWFLEALLEHFEYHEAAALIGKKRVVLSLREQDLFEELEVRFLAVVVLDDEAETEQVYRVSSEKLEPFRFRFVERITMVHPLNSRVSSLDVRQWSLSDFLSRTCGRGAVDYVCAMDLAGIKISGRITGRSKLDCIVHAATVAGGMVELVRGSEILKVEDSTERLEDHFNASSNFWEALRDFLNRDFLNEWTDEVVGPPIETVLDAWRNFVLAQAKSWQEERVLIRIVDRPVERPSERR